MFVWGYSIVWALVNDRAKLVAYAIFDKQQANISTPPKLITPADAAPKAKDSTVSTGPKVKIATNSVKANTPTDMTQQIKERAYEIYEERGHNTGQAGRDWAQAEHQIRKDQHERILLQSIVPWARMPVL